MARLPGIGTRPVCQAAGIQGATPYALRHSFVSEGVPAGVPLEVLADLAGHRDVETTDRVYRARRDDVQRAAAEALGKHLQQLTSGTVDDATAEEWS